MLGRLRVSIIFGQIRSEQLPYGVRLLVTMMVKRFVGTVVLKVVMKFGLWWPQVAIHLVVESCGCCCK